MNQDQDHLKLLSVFHYVVAALTALFSLIPVVHLVVGIALASGAFDGTDSDAQTVGWFFAAIAGVMILIGWTFAALVAFAGRSLARQRNYTFCLVMAGLACMLMPFGTVLGVFTIIVLMRESVKELFGEGGGSLREQN